MGSDLERRCPDMVALAAILLAVGSLIGAGKAVLSPYPMSVVVPIAVLYLSFVGVSVGMFMLKKWSYWAFVILVTASAISISFDLLFVTIGIAPKGDAIFVQILQLVIRLAWIVYFITPTVRGTFKVGVAG